VFMSRGYGTAGNARRCVCSWVRAFVHSACGRQRWSDRRAVLEGGCSTACRDRPGSQLSRRTGEWPVRNRESRAPSRGPSPSLERSGHVGAGPPVEKVSHRRSVRVDPAVPRDYRPGIPGGRQVSPSGQLGVSGLGWISVGHFVPAGPREGVSHRTPRAGLRFAVGKTSRAASPGGSAVTKVSRPGGARTKTPQGGGTKCPTDPREQSPPCSRGAARQTIG
jgi:hypothetical protein